jgi:hypothetical protein
MGPIDFGMFFFNSDDDEIAGNYAMHAKKVVCERVAEREPRVRESRWSILSGDLFGPRSIQILLTTSAMSPDKTRIDSELQQGFAAGRMPSFVPYVIGMFMCPLDALRHADTRLKQDKVAGYLGLATFILPDQKTLQEISEALTLPMTSMHSV